MATRKAMPVSLPLVAGSTSPTALAAPVVLGMVLMAAARPPRQSFLDGPSTVFWVAVIGVNRGHQTGLDAETFLQQHMHERREAVRGAGGVGNDVVLGRIVFAFVDAHDDGLDLAFAGRGDDDFLGAGGEVGLGLLAVGEEAGGFDDDVHAERLPRQRGEVLDAP